MAVQIIDVEQGSPEWLLERCGLVTASEFSTVFAKGRGGGESVTRRKYANKLAGERIVKAPEQTYWNSDMNRGKEMEAEARETYAFINGVKPELVGFVRDTERMVGCSPDSFIGHDGILEIKTAVPSILIEYIRKGMFPPEHFDQCQGNMWITGRAWCDIAVYWPGMPLFQRRMSADPDYFGLIERAVATFELEIRQIVEAVERYGGTFDPEQKTVLAEVLEASQ